MKTRKPSKRFPTLLENVRSTIMQGKGINPKVLSDLSQEQVDYFCSIARRWGNLAFLGQVEGRRRNEGLAVNTAKPKKLNPRPKVSVTNLGAIRRSYATVTQPVLRHDPASVVLPAGSTPSAQMNKALVSGVAQNNNENKARLRKKLRRRRPSLGTIGSEAAAALRYMAAQRDSMSD